MNSFARFALVPLALAAVAGCGGQHGTLELTVVVSPVDDPFADAASVVITIGDPNHQKTYPVTGGHFKASIDLSPLSTPGPVRMDLLDTSGKEVAYGQTTELDLSAIDQVASIWIGRPGHIDPAVAALSEGLTDMTAVSIPGVGILFAGGRTAGGAPSQDASIYLTLEQSIFPATGLTTARAGAVAATIGEEAVVFGGGTNDFFDGSGAPLGSAEIFDPASGQAGVWSGVPGDTVPARGTPALTALGSGNLLISGGFDTNHAPLDSAAFITTGGTVMLQNIAGTMAKPRGGHVACAATFGAGSGALLIGGLATDDPANVAESLIGQSFSPVTLNGVENRLNATCTTMPSGKILLVGGYVDGTPVATGFVIDPSTTPLTVTALPSALSSPRARHTASLLGSGNVLVCGGESGALMNVGSCDLINGVTFALMSSVQMTTPRRDHVASVIDTGQVIVAGGIGTSGQPVTSIEIYTP